MTCKECIHYDVCDGYSPFIHETKIDGIALQKDAVWLNSFTQDGLRMGYKIDDVGKDIFFTRKEAEKALKENEK